MNREENAQNPLSELLAELMTRKAKRAVLKEKMLAKGYTVEDYKMFGTLRGALEDFSHVAGAVNAIAVNAKHVPSAQYVLETVKYLRGAVRFMYGVLEKTQTDPRDFDMRSTPDHVLSEMDDVAAEAQKIMDDAKAAEELAKSVQAG